MESERISEKEYDDGDKKETEDQAVLSSHTDVRSPLEKRKRRWLQRKVGGVGRGEGGEREQKAKERESERERE